MAEVFCFKTNIGSQSRVAEEKRHKQHTQTERDEEQAREREGEEGVQTLSSTYLFK